MSESSGTKTSTVREPYMLDFHLWDAAQQPALSSLAVDGQTMTLGIRNTSRGAITLNELPDAHDYHFILRFRKGTLLNPANIRVEGPDTQWEKVDPTVPAPAHNVQEIYLRGPAGHVIAPGETRVLELHGVQADPGPGTRNTRVEFAYQSLTFAERPLAGHREKTLSVTSVGGLMQPAVKQMPLYVGFGGSNTILNDGKSPNSLRVQLTNTDPQHNELRFPAGEPALARIILTFDVGDDAQRGWGLATRNELKTIEPTLHGGTDTQGQVVTWDFEFLSEAAREQWIFSPAVQTPISLAAGQALELSITNITSSLPASPANLYLRCENIPGYPDRDYVLTVQKTPLVYGDRLVGIGTSEPSHSLHIAGNNAALRLTGTGTNGAEAKLNFGDGEYVYLHEDQDDRLTIHARLGLALTGGDVKVDGSINAAAAHVGAITVRNDKGESALNGGEIAEQTIALSKLAAAVQQALCPVGTILPYAGDKAPPGWLMCDGQSSLDPRFYFALFGMIGYRFGGFTRSGIHYFITPDLRGRFLRGMDNGSWPKEEDARDPDRKSRTAMYPEGATGIAVGSVQGDAFKSHSHNIHTAGRYRVGENRTWQGESGSPTPTYVQDGPTDAEGGSETRPKNMYVNYIIKY